MKSRRHRAIDKADKQKTMCCFNLNRKAKKRLSKRFKIIDRKYYDKINVILKNKKF